MAQSNVRFPASTTLWPAARSSISSRLSRLWKQNHTSESTQDGFRVASEGCEVPIYFSQSSNDLDGEHSSQHNIYAARSPRSTRSIIEPATVFVNGARPLTVPASSVYSNSPRHECRSRLGGTFEYYATRPPVATHDLESCDHDDGDNIDTSPVPDVLSEKRPRRPRKGPSLKSRIATKKRFSMAFGITLLFAVIAYLVLAITKIASGLMFHILMILVLLILAGIFLHSAIRLVMLQKYRQERKKRRQDRRQYGSSTSDLSSQSSSISSTEAAFVAEPAPVEPIQVIMAEDEDSPKSVRKAGRAIKLPPPVYGNFRDSKRMNPNLVYWKKTSPSPTTPTYEEAMRNAHTALGMQPPVYISPRRAQKQPASHQRESDVHPLERQRLDGLLDHSTAF